jgi:hypothetical protein
LSRGDVAAKCGDNYSKYCETTENTGKFIVDAEKKLAACEIHAAREIHPMRPRSYAVVRG